jgi:hypothetical protein
MEFNEIEARLLISRKLQEDEDWDIYEYIFNDIYNLQKVYPLKVYYKGFTDAWKRYFGHYKMTLVTFTVKKKLFFR